MQKGFIRVLVVVAPESAHSFANCTIAAIRRAVSVKYWMTMTLTDKHIENGPAPVAHGESSNRPGISTRSNRLRRLPVCAERSAGNAV